MPITQQVSGAVGQFIPGFVTLGSTFQFLTWILFFLLFLAGGGVVGFIYLYRRKFNKKIVIFEKINGVFQPTRSDRASEVKLSTSGDTIFYLKKHKKYIPNPSIQTGIRTYWFFIREDDEWINFGLEDLDLLSKKVGARFLDKEMRFARTQIQKGLKERYDKPSFWQQYGLLLFSIAYIVIIGIMTWLLFDKWIELAGTTNAGVETAAKVMEKIDQTMGSLANLCSGSGLKR